MASYGSLPFGPYGSLAPMLVWTSMAPPDDPLPLTPVAPWAIWLPWPLQCLLVIRSPGPYGSLAPMALMAPWPLMALLGDPRCLAPMAPCPLWPLWLLGPYGSFWWSSPLWPLWLLGPLWLPRPYGLYASSW